MKMSSGRGRGKVNTSELKKDEKTWAGPKLPAVSFTNSESAMDEYLSKLDLYRKPVAKDGSCLFRVVSEQVYNTQAKHIQVRFECIDFMRKNKERFQAFIEGSYEHHLYSLKNPKEWGGQVEISALSLLYKYDFIVYQAINHPPQRVTGNNFKRKIHLCYSNGNHYDAVYPVKFKENAAMVQSLLYDIVLDRTFREVDRKVIRKEDSTENATHISGTGWTEVKPKQKGKLAEEANDRGTSNDRILNLFPDAAENKKLLWQLQRSFDMTFYRNIELEVWEDFRSEITKSDYALAASMQQLKPGDICLATIKESKDISETIRVKISEINPDKCIVYSEDERTRYYVQLHDLEPLINGDVQDYKSLPGYYNKVDEREAEFQQPKRRGKGGKKLREEDDRNRNSFRGAEPKRYDARTSNKRGGRKENEKRRDNIDSKPSVNTSRKIKSDADVRKFEKPDELIPKVASPVVSPDEPPKVAKPAETSAAFWGRMNRTTKLPGSTPVTNGVVPSPAVPSSSGENSIKRSNVETGSVASSSTTTTTGPRQFVDSNSASAPTSTIKMKTAWGNVPSSASPVVESSPSEISSKTSMLPKNYDNELSDAKILNEQESGITKNIKMKKSDLNLTEISDILVNGHNSNETLVECSSLNSSDFPVIESAHKSSTPAIGSSSSENHMTTQLTAEDHAKVNEVRGNIIASIAKMTNTKSSDFLDKKVSNEKVSQTIPNEPTYINGEQSDSSETTSAVLPPEGSKEINSDKNNSNIVDINIESNDAVLEGEPPGVADSLLNGSVNAAVDDENTAQNTPNGHTAFSAEKHFLEPNILNSDVSLNNHVSEDDINSKDEIISKEKSKKKVSFGTTSIIENQNQVMSQVPTINMQPTPSTLTTLSEPGKIVLPPEHIEKHINEFPNSNAHEVPEYPHNQQQPHFLPAVFQPSNLPFYAHSPMVRMFYPNNAIPEHQHHQLNAIHPVMSVDPEGKDLPDDINVLRYFYNLGIQRHYMIAQPNNVHLNQPGILPPPLQTQSVHATTVRPLVMAQDATHMRSPDCYSPGSQSNDTNVHIDLLSAQHPQATTFLSNARVHSLPQPHNLVHMQHTPGYEEYEIPPRHQRNTVTINRGNSRHANQPRHFMNPRGIVGQNPRHRHQMRTTGTHQGNHVANF